MMFNLVFSYLFAHLSQGGTAWSPNPDACAGPDMDFVTLYICFCCLSIPVCDSKWTPGKYNNTSSQTK